MLKPLLHLVLLSAMTLSSVGAVMMGCTTTGEVREGLTFLEAEDGDILSGSVVVTAVPQGLGKISGVEFYLGDARIDSVLLKPYSTLLDTTMHPDSVTTLRAVAVKDGEALAEVSISVRIDNNGPEITMLQPVETSLFYSGPIDLEFDIEDPAGLENVAIAVNGIALPTDGPPWITAFDLDDLFITPADLPIDLVVTVTALDGAGQNSFASYDLQLASRLAWKFRTLDEVWAAPAFSSDGSTIYLGSRDSRLYALDMNGQEIWRYEAGAEIVTSPVVTDTGDILVSAGSNLHLVSAAGMVVWNTPIGNAAGTAATVYQGVAYVGSYGDALVAIDLATGMELWRHMVGGDIQSRPLVVGNGTIVFGSHDGFVHGVDTANMDVFAYETGDQVWSNPVLSNDGDILVGSNDGYLYRLDSSGVLQWEFETRGQIWGSPAEAPDGSIYVASTFRRLYALDSNGVEQWQSTFTGFAESTPVVSPDHTIYVAASDGTVYALTRLGTEAWSFRADSEIIGSPILTPDQTLLLVGSNDRHLYALRTGTFGCAEPDMVTVGDRQVMRFEASRPDATATSQGIETDTVCSRSGVLPWTDVTWSEAQALCQSAGLTLCPGQLWLEACQGTGGTDFPYGIDYIAGTCVDTDHPVGGCLVGGCNPVPTGAAAGCVSGTGVFDASGNVREWTGDQVPAGALVRGGGFRDTMDGLRCSNVLPDTHVLDPNTRRDDIGFRCCQP